MERRFTLEKRLIVIILLAAVALLPSAFGVQVSVSSDTGGLTEKIEADNDQPVSGSTVIGTDSVSHSITGKGSLRERHRVSNSAGAYAEVSAKVRRAESYSYSYEIWPGSGHRWPASEYPTVGAAETLNVLNAQYIQANALAYNAKGYTATSSTEIYDRGRKASLIGFFNRAEASADSAFTTQGADYASSPGGYIKTDSRSRSLNWRDSLGLKSNSAGASTRIDKGSITRYYDQAGASDNGAGVPREISNASGEKIRIQSGSRPWISSIFSVLKKKTDADVSTVIAGSLQDYDDYAWRSAELAETKQTARGIQGSFTSTATADKTTKTRTSNYGTDYGLEMRASKGTSGSFVSGTLAYYVDDDNPAASQIQGAVNAAEPGDSISVAEGTYRENVDIQKSLMISGDTSGDTIVDGQQAGSVFTIGSLSNTQLDVGLSGMAIKNGAGTAVAIIPSMPYFKPKLGGGILNYGTLTLDDISITGNKASVGGGIFNYLGSVNMGQGSIDHNDAIAGAGIGSYFGHIELNGGSIQQNDAVGGGGIAAYGGYVDINGGSISDNSAAVGGGIAAYESNVNIDGGYVNGNKAIIGGGIASYEGSLNLNDGSISNNQATAVKSIDEYLQQLGIKDGAVDPKTAAVLEALTGYSIDELKYKGAIAAGEVTAFLDELEKNGISIDREKMTAGGGIASFKTELNLNGGSIDHNSATIGGGIASYGGAVNINGASIGAGNNATIGGGLASIYSQINLNSGSIANNDAAVGGGIASYRSLANLNGGLVSNNKAVVGGGVANYQGTANLNGSTVSRNAAAALGGGILNYQGTINLLNGSVNNNFAKQTGGGIYNTGMVKGDTELVHDNAPNQIFPDQITAS